MSVTDATDAEARGARQPGGDAHGTGPTTTTGGDDGILITVNRKDYEAPKPDMTGIEIKEMAGAPLHHALILVAGDPGGGADGDGQPVPDDAAIHLARGMRFRTVNRAEFGCAMSGSHSVASLAHGGDGGDATLCPGNQAAALTELPPKLREHIAILEGRGYKVEAVDNGEIGIVIKDYKIPAHIWSRPSADLRLSTDSSYPEPKIGPFWLCPPVSRRNGDTVRATGSTVWEGRTWQTFHWEVVHWDPRYDNLLTHLDVVDDRMWRDE